MTPASSKARNKRSGALYLVQGERSPALLNPTAYSVPDGWLPLVPGCRRPDIIGECIYTGSASHCPLAIEQKPIRDDLIVIIIIISIILTSFIPIIPVRLLRCSVLSCPASLQPISRVLSSLGPWPPCLPLLTPPFSSFLGCPVNIIAGSSIYPPFLHLSLVLTSNPLQISL